MPRCPAILDVSSTCLDYDEVMCDLPKGHDGRHEMTVKPKDETLDTPGRLDGSLTAEQADF